MNLEDGVLGPSEHAEIVALYDGELLCMDHALARILARLQEHPRWEEMLVIVTSDHGDAFGEHHTMAHGVSIYDEQVRIRAARCHFSQRLHVGAIQGVGSRHFDVGG